MYPNRPRVCNLMGMYAIDIQDSLANHPGSMKAMRNPPNGSTRPFPSLHNPDDYTQREHYMPRLAYVDSAHREITTASRQQKRQKDKPQIVRVIKS